LQRTELIRQVIPTEVMCPAAGQGALGIEIRAGDSLMRECLSLLDDPVARATTSCERALLNSLGGGCQVPIGAFAQSAQGTLILNAVVASPDGSKLLRQHGTGEDPERLGAEVGASLLRRGAQEILREVYGEIAVQPQQP
jgi:hydroxymethylbilane synthase